VLHRGVDLGRPLVLLHPLRHILRQAVALLEGSEALLAEESVHLYAPLRQMAEPADDAADAVPVLRAQLIDELVLLDLFQAEDDGFQRVYGHHVYLVVTVVHGMLVEQVYGVRRHDQKDFLLDAGLLDVLLDLVGLFHHVVPEVGQVVALGALGVEDDILFAYQ